MELLKEEKYDFVLKFILVTMPNISSSGVYEAVNSYAADTQRNLYYDRRACRIVSDDNCVRQITFTC